VDKRAPFFCRSQASGGSLTGRARDDGTSRTPNQPAAIRTNRIADRVATITLWGAALFVTGVFVWIVVGIVAGGAHAVSWHFLTSAPQNSGRAGGIAPVLVSTALILAVCMSVALPIGVATAIVLSEFTRGRALFTRFVRRSLDTLSGIPSIVFGLFGSVFFCQVLGLGFSIAAGGLTLACMVLPLLIRAAEEGLRAVPDDYRRQAAALGLSRLATVRHLLLPAATPGIVVGVVLGTGRAAAETAALIFTSGYVDRMPGSLFDSGRALTVHIYDLSMNVSGGDTNAYASALVLVSALLVINTAASWIAEHWLHRRILRA